MEDHVGRNALLPGGGGPPRPQLLEQPSGLRGQLGGLAPARLGRFRRLRRPLRVAPEHDLALLAKDGGTRVGQREGAVVAFDRQQALGQQLADDAAPLRVAQLGADPEHRQRGVAVLVDLVRLLAEQDVDDVTGTEPLPALALETVHGGQEFLGGHRPVP